MMFCFASMQSANLSCYTRQHSDAFSFLGVSCTALNPINRFQNKLEANGLTEPSHKVQALAVLVKPRCSASS